MKEAGYLALDGCIRTSPVYGSALAEGLGLTEISGDEKLLEEANFMMASIEKGIRSADRRHARIEQGLANDRDRGGRQQ